ncbi:MAG: hypothetical protein KF773_38310 [Deltaproteobacteria bacterium]|nr:hypothetical protein [Deltaproteobacteria bacterium]
MTFDLRYSRRKRPREQLRERAIEQLKKQHVAIARVRIALETAHGDREVREILQGLQELVDQYEAKGEKATRNRGIVEHFSYLSRILPRIKQRIRQKVSATAIDEEHELSAWLTTNRSPQTASEIIELVGKKRDGAFKGLAHEIIGKLSGVKISPAEVKRIVNNNDNDKRRR